MATKPLTSSSNNLPSGSNSKRKLLNTPFNSTSPKNIKSRISSEKAVFLRYFSLNSGPQSPLQTNRRVLCGQSDQQNRQKRPFYQRNGCLLKENSSYHEKLKRNIQIQIVLLDQRQLCAHLRLCAWDQHDERFQ